MEEQTVVENQAVAGDEDSNGKEKRRYKVGEFDGPLDLLWTLSVTINSTSMTFQSQKSPSSSLNTWIMPLPLIWATCQTSTNGLPALSISNPA